MHIKTGVEGEKNEDLEGKSNEVLNERLSKRGSIVYLIKRKSTFFNGCNYAGLERSELFEETGDDSCIFSSKLSLGWGAEDSRPSINSVREFFERHAGDGIIRRANFISRSRRHRISRDIKVTQQRIIQDVVHHIYDSSIRLCLICCLP